MAYIDAMGLDRVVPDPPGEITVFYRVNEDDEALLEEIATKGDPNYDQALERWYFLEGFVKEETLEPPIEEKGGPGSGNWGHAGRPGKIGGSMPQSVAMSRTSGRTATARYIAAKRGSTGVVIQDMKNRDWRKIEDFEYTPGISQSYVVQLTHDGKAIVKPLSTESDYKNEEIVYDLQADLGWNMMPVSVGEKYVSEEGSFLERGEQHYSVQQWSEGKRTAGNLYYVEDATQSKDWFEYGTEDLDEQSFSRMGLIDAVIGNQDRHMANFLLDRGGEAIMIDHNISFRDWGDNNGESYYRIADNHYTDLRRRVFGYDAQSGSLKTRRSDYLSIWDKVNSDKFKTKITTHFGDQAYNDVLDRINSIPNYLDKNDLWIEDV